MFVCPTAYTGAQAQPPSNSTDWEAAAKYYSSIRQQTTSQPADSSSSSDSSEKTATTQNAKKATNHLDLHPAKKRHKSASESTQASVREGIGLDPGEGLSHDRPAGDEDGATHHEGGDLGQQDEDTISYLLKRVDQNPHDYETSHQLVTALASTDRLDDYECALERILAEFPLLFGYWKKLGKFYLEKRRSWPETERVVERACEFVGHNPMIWVAYLEWTKEACSLTKEATRVKIDQAVESAGLHWKSWPLWQAVLEFEEAEYSEACTKIALSSGQSHDDNEKAEESSEDFLKKEELRLYHIKTRDAAVERLRMLYRKLHSTPIESMDLGWDRFKALLGKDEASATKTAPGALDKDLENEDLKPLEIMDLLADDELRKLYQNLLEQKNSCGDKDKDTKTVSDEEIAKLDRAAIKKEVSTLASQNAVEEACWAVRKALFAEAAEQAAARQVFENGVHRWFWHPDPLTPQRIQAWRDYLDFEDQNGSQERKDMLRKRCLEVCASYLEFWQRFSRQLLEEGKRTEALQLLYKGAYTVMKRRRDLAFAYALMAEQLGRFEDATKAYNYLLEPPLSPAYLKYYLGWISYQRRRGERERVLQLYDEGLQRFSAHPQCCELLHLHKANFTLHIEGDLKSTVSHLMKAYEALPTSVCLFQMLVRLLQLKHMGDGDRIFAAVSPVFAEALKNAEMTVWDKWQIWKMHVKFLETYAPTVEQVQNAKASAFSFLRENRVELVRLAPKAFRQRIPEGLRSEAPTADGTEDSGYYLGATGGVQYGDVSAAGWAGQGAYCGYETLPSLLDLEETQSLEILHLLPSISYVPLWSSSSSPRDFISSYPTEDSQSPLLGDLQLSPPGVQAPDTIEEKPLHERSKDHGLPYGCKERRIVELSTSRKRVSEDLQSEFPPGNPLVEQKMDGESVWRSRQKNDERSGSENESKEATCQLARLPPSRTPNSVSEEEEDSFRPNDYSWWSVKIPEALSECDGDQPPFFEVPAIEKQRGGSRFSVKKRTPAFAVQVDEQEAFLNRVLPRRFIRSPVGRHGAFLEEKPASLSRHRSGRGDRRDETRVGMEVETVDEETTLSSKPNQGRPPDTKNAKGSFFTGSNDSRETDVSGAEEEEEKKEEDHHSLSIDGGHEEDPSDGETEDGGDKAVVTTSTTPLNREFSTIPISALFDIHVAEFCRGYRHAGAFSYDNFKNAVAQSYRVRMNPTAPSRSSSDGLTSLTPDKIPGLRALQASLEDYEACRQWVFRFCTFLRLHEELAYISVYLMHFLLMRWSSWQPPPRLILPEYRAIQSVAGGSGGSKTGDRNTSQKVASSSSSLFSPRFSPEVEDAQTRSILWGVYHIEISPSHSLESSQQIPKQLLGSSQVSYRHVPTSTVPSKVPARDGFWTAVSPSPISQHPLPPLVRLACVCIAIAYKQLEVVPHLDCAGIVIEAIAFVKEENVSLSQNPLVTPTSAPGAGRKAEMLPLPGGTTRNSHAPRPFWAVTGHQECEEGLFQSPSDPSEQSKTRPSFLSHSPSIGCCNCCRSTLNGQDVEDFIRSTTGSKQGITTGTAATGGSRALYHRGGSDRIVFQLKDSRGITPSYGKGGGARYPCNRTSSSSVGASTHPAPPPAWPPTGWLELYAWSCIEEEGLLTHANVFLFLQWLLGASKLHRRKYGARWLPSITRSVENKKKKKKKPLVEKTTSVRVHEVEEDASPDQGAFQSPENNGTNFSIPPSRWIAEYAKRGNLPASRSRSTRLVHTEFAGESSFLGSSRNKSNAGGGHSYEAAGRMWCGSSLRDQEGEIECVDTKQIGRKFTDDFMSLTPVLHDLTKKQETCEEDDIFLLPACPRSALPLYILQIALCSRDPCFLSVPPPIQAACVLRFLLTCFACETKHTRFLDAVLGPELIPDVKAATDYMKHALLAAACSTSPLWAWRLPGEVVHNLFPESNLEGGGGPGPQCRKCRLSFTNVHIDEEQQQRPLRGEVTSGGMHGQRPDRKNEMSERKKEKFAVEDDTQHKKEKPEGITRLLEEEWNDKSTSPSSSLDLAEPQHHAPRGEWRRSSHTHGNPRGCCLPTPSGTSTPVRRRDNKEGEESSSSSSPNATDAISPHHTWSIAALLCPHGNSRWDLECSRCCVSPSSSIRKHFSKTKTVGSDRDCGGSSESRSEEQAGKGLTSSGPATGAREAESDTCISSNSRRYQAQQMQQEEASAAYQQLMLQQQLQQQQPQQQGTFDTPYQQYWDPTTSGASIQGYYYDPQVASQQAAASLYVTAASTTTSIPSTHSRASV
ncbi:prpf39 related [Cystoisospora suis]|uniref:Prpf39 related n=1 Tax=Cystoisospora suis TaxID=483139 RepID=A0A2C6KZ59_9APIC|nr:prpf39 related [Cystoisospora suis]